MDFTKVQEDYAYPYIKQWLTKGKALVETTNDGAVSGRVTPKRNVSGQGHCVGKIPAPKTRIRAFGYRFILIL
jgi:hypothetical protein